MSDDDYKIWNLEPNPGFYKNECDCPNCGVTLVYDTFVPRFNFQFEDGDKHQYILKKGVYVPQDKSSVGIIYARDIDGESIDAMFKGKNDL